MHIYGANSLFLAPEYLGEVSYSTYLLHGFVFFVAYYFIIGLEVMKTFSATQYSMIAFCVTPFIIMASALGFTFIEKPFSIGIPIGYIFLKLTETKRITEIFTMKYFTTVVYQ